ncbi:uncharacterized protein LOC142550267 [Primulina tabacum]|uniref:uncharacterized protein LOC142550267 n=1 Tax=Primulina tabacum TaxID=48773 RepID=UPI003F5A0F79
MAGKSLIDRLKKAVKKIKVLLDYNANRWKIASLIGKSTGKRSRLSFKVKPGLKEYAEDSESSDDHHPRSSPQLHRTQSHPVEVDIDKRADAFIEKFRNQLKYERQISLQLRYYRGNSFESVTSP